MVLFCIFAQKKFAMERNMVLHIDDAILRKAFLYAKIKGVDLSAIVERFLSQFASAPLSYEEKIKKFPISQEVRDLVGHPKGNPAAIDWDKEKEEYLSQKYGL